MRCRIRQLAMTDIPEGMRLKTEAGWNQTVSDWQRFMMLEPEGCFAAECDGRLVGTATTCTFQHVAWVGMMLVRKQLRGQGIGRLLFSAALDYVHTHGVTCVRLDATPLGRPLYESFGFRTQFDFVRMSGVPARQAVPRPPIEVTRSSTSISHLSDITALDRRMSDTDRTKLFEVYLRQGVEGELFHSHGQLTGFCFRRVGENAVQVGPCVSSQAAVGELALRSTLNQLCGRPVYVDVPCERAAPTRAVTEYGLCEQRRLFRMYVGEEIRENLDYLWSSSGPELG